MFRPVNRINPAKLQRSKWTALDPRNRQKHFIVTRLLRDENRQLVACELEAVIDHQSFRIDWQELRDASRWAMGSTQSILRTDDGWTGASDPRQSGTLTAGH